MQFVQKLLAASTPPKNVKALLAYTIRYDSKV